ncbi:hypothetical protein H0H92_009794 [Tricholoma furcatifolium]|nr:hypothetical protein H0H92_009794 [Tricholoma furcatifolium]
MDCYPTTTGAWNNLLDCTKSAKGINRKAKPLQVLTNSTTMMAQGSTSNSSTLPTERRRIQRYAVAEAELARQFEKCQTERPPLELQIRGLKEATLILGAHAQDARERAEKLRELLADRDVEPETYELLQRERWFQERRQSAVDEETKLLQHQLKILNNPSLLDMDTPRDGTAKEKERRRRNLMKFLDASAERPPICVRRATSVLCERPQKRRTLDRVSPMRLRSTSSLSRASFQPLRPMSLDGWTRRPHHTSKTSSNIQPSLPPPLHLVSEGDSFEAESTATSGTSYVSSFTTESYLSTPLTTATSLPTPQTPSYKTEPETDDENGTATIYLDTRMSNVEYTPEDVAPPLPDYALDLFSRFDYNIDINITQPLFTDPYPGRFSDVGPRRSLVTKLLPSRHSSSFLEVPSLSPSKRHGHKSPQLEKSRSQRQLGGLFCIPEALSSRTGTEVSEKIDPDHEDDTSRSPSRTSMTPSAVSEDVKMNLTTIFSGLGFSGSSCLRPPASLAQMPLLPNPWDGPLPRSAEQPHLVVSLRVFRKQDLSGTREYPYEMLKEKPNQVPFYEMTGHGPPPKDIPGYPGDMYIDKEVPIVIYVCDRVGWKKWNDRSEDGQPSVQLMLTHPYIKNRYLGKVSITSKISWYTSGTLNGANIPTRYAVSIVPCKFSIDGFIFRSTVRTPASSSRPLQLEHSQSVSTSSLRKRKFRELDNYRRECAEDDALDLDSDIQITAASVLKREFVEYTSIVESAKDLLDFVSQAEKSQALLQERERNSAEELVKLNDELREERQRLKALEQGSQALSQAKQTRETELTKQIDERGYSVKSLAQAREKELTVQIDELKGRLCDEEKARIQAQRQLKAEKAQWKIRTGKLAMQSVQAEEKLKEGKFCLKFVILFVYRTLLI